MTEQTNELIFEDPPGRPGGPGKASPIAAWLDALRSHPGQWARFPEAGSKSTMGTKAHNIKRAVCYRVAVGEFDAKSRTIDDKTYLFACYLGSDRSAGAS